MGLAIKTMFLKIYISQVTLYGCETKCNRQKKTLKLLQCSITDIRSKIRGAPGTPVSFVLRRAKEKMQI